MVEQRALMGQRRLSSPRRTLPGALALMLMLTLGLQQGPRRTCAVRPRILPARMLVTQSPNAPAEAGALSAAARAWGKSFRGARTWQASIPCSAWVGVTCGKGNHVTKLQLDSKGLRGPLPASLGSIPSLTLLSLQGNSLWGGIPRNWSSLTNLKYLNLAYNRLTGVFPVWIGGLPALTFLSLGYNRLKGGIPEGLTKLAGLETLLAQRNYLSGHIPSILPGLVKLTSMNLAYNLLTGPLPGSLLNYTAPAPKPALQSLNVTRNRLSGEVVGVERLPNLLILDLSYNWFSGRIPNSWGPSLAPETGGIKLQENYFIGTSVITSSRQPHGIGCLRDISFDNEVTGNCIQTAADSYTVGPVTTQCPPTPQKGLRYCVGFCNATDPAGPCGGHGTCSFHIMGRRMTGTCSCETGYRQPKGRPGVCVKQ